jgi:AhpD family alkylhydroperoxidase
MAQFEERLRIRVRGEKVRGLVVIDKVLEIEEMRTRRRTMETNWPGFTDQLRPHLKNLHGGVPEVMKAFSAIAQAALAPKALDTKTKELVALGISVAIRCDDCIAFHVKAALDHGATRDEVLETLGMAIYLGAGPSVMYASHALAALTQFEAAKIGQAS